MSPTCDIRIGHVTRFKKGQHWRKPRPFWSKDWLLEEYSAKGRSAHDIAVAFGVGDTAIHFWLKKHGIATRSTSEARKLKRWGSPGPANPMFGRVGPESSNWRGGLTPLRQRWYSTDEWRSVSRRVRQRDHSCRLCPSKGPTHIHHIEPFAAAPLLNFDEGNLILLCVRCHKKVGRRVKWWRRRLHVLANHPRT